MENNYKETKAFTLAEIMVVVTIVAVVAASTVGIQKIKTDYVNKFMYYAAFTNLKLAASEMIAEGSDSTSGSTSGSTSSDDDIVSVCGADEIYVANPNETAFNNWKSAWNTMEGTPKNCAVGPNSCTIAHDANDTAAAYYNSLSGSPNLSNCTSQYWANTSCSALTYPGAKGSCLPAKSYYSQFNLVKQYYDDWCDTSDPTKYDLYYETVTHSHEGSCPNMKYISSCSPYHEYNINTELEGFCYINGASADTQSESSGSGGGSGSSGSGTGGTGKILPDTAAKFCSSYTDMLNGIGVPVCGNGIHNTEPFDSANANIILPNGIRYYNFGAEATPGATNETGYYIIYADIDGSARNGKLNEDVMGFKVYRSGLVLPLLSTAPSTKYLSTSVRYTDGSGNVQFLETGVPYLDAACHAGLASGVDCPASTTLSPTCDKANGGFDCTVIVNKPGF